MNTTLVAYAIFATVVAVWALWSLALERSHGRLIDEFRERDARDYWRLVDALAAYLTPKALTTKQRKGRAKK